MPEKIIKEDLFYVLAKAVEAFKAAAMRHRNGYIAHGFTAAEVIKKFPNYYAKQSDNKVKFIGISADEILENYLGELGYERGSRKFYRLAHLVVGLSKEGEVDIETYIKQTRIPRK
tara:strand:+ start:71 stop:418 length:348 start_codon:yes stop_codon:yes gene_type:complete